MSHVTNFETSRTLSVTIAPRCHTSQIWNTILAGVTVTPQVEVERLIVTDCECDTLVDWLSWYNSNLLHFLPHSLHSAASSWIQQFSTLLQKVKLCLHIFRRENVTDSNYLAYHFRQVLFPRRLIAQLGNTPIWLVTQTLYPVQSFRLFPLKLCCTG
jgi:hypothetical protein